MLSLPLPVRVYLCLEPADMRRSFDGLGQMVRDFLDADPLSGDICLFFAAAAAIGSSCCTGSATAWPSGTSVSKKACSRFRPALALRACRGRVRPASTEWRFAPRIWRCCSMASICRACGAASVISGRSTRLGDNHHSSDTSEDISLFSFFSRYLFLGPVFHPT